MKHFTKIHQCLIFAFLLLIVIPFSCKKSKQIDNPFTSYYENDNNIFSLDGKLQETHYWNELGLDYASIYYSGKGDTLETTIFFYGYGASALYGNDSIDFAFRLVDENTGNGWLQEYFTVCRNSRKVSPLSYFFHVLKVADTILIQHWGIELEDLHAISYGYDIDDNLVVYDTIHSLDNITLIDEITQDRKLVEFQIFGNFIETEQDFISEPVLVIRRTYLPVVQKIIFQELLSINQFLRNQRKAIKIN